MYLNISYKQGKLYLILVTRNIPVTDHTKVPLTAPSVTDLSSVVDKIEIANEG